MRVVFGGVSVETLNLVLMFLNDFFFKFFFLLSKITLMLMLANQLYFGFTNFCTGFAQGSPVTSSQVSMSSFDDVAVCNWTVEDVCRKLKSIQGVTWLTKFLFL